MIRRYCFNWSTRCFLDHFTSCCILWSTGFKHIDIPY